MTWKRILVSMLLSLAIAMTVRAYDVEECLTKAPQPEGRLIGRLAPTAEMDSCLGDLAHRPWEKQSRWIDSVADSLRQEGGTLLEADFLLYVYPTLWVSMKNDSILHYMRKAEDAYRVENDQVGLVKAWSNVTEIFSDSRLSCWNPDSAREYNSRVMEYFEEAHDSLNIAATLMQRARITDSPDYPPFDRNDIREALGIYEALDNQEGIELATRSVAFSFARGGDFDSALVYLYESIPGGKRPLERIAGDAQFLAWMHLGAGNLAEARVVTEIELSIGRELYDNNTYGINMWPSHLMSWGHYREAIPYIDVVIEDWSSFGYLEGTWLYLAMKADCYSHLGINDSALLLYDSAISGGFSSDEPYYGVLPRDHKVMHHIRREEFRSAHSLVNENLQYSRAQEDPTFEIVRQLSMHADIHRASGESAAAMDSLYAAIDLAVSAEREDWASDAYQVLAELHLESGDTSRAIVNLEKAAALYERNRPDLAWGIRAFVDSLSR